MGNVYAVDAKQNLILYTTGNYICLRTSVGENLTRPIILCNDYASGLSDLVYHNTIYYVYQNTNRDILLRSVIEPNALYQINSRSTPDCFDPQIAVVRETLLLFYFVRNPVDNSYRLKALLPLQPERKLFLPGSLFAPAPASSDTTASDPASSAVASPASDEAIFPSLPVLRILSLGASLLVHLSVDTEAFLFTIDESLQCEKLLPASSLPLAELDKNKALLSEAQTQIDSLRSELSSRDQLIQSIRAQYEELMDTAMKYREEAAKWHDQFYKKARTPL